MSEKNRTFAYVLLSSSWSQELETELLGHYWGGIVEAFIDCDEQAVDAEGLYPFGWESIMNRIAPVQMTIGWDPRQNLMKGLLDEGGIPRFTSVDNDDLPNIIFFEQPAMRGTTDKAVNTDQIKDRRQFNKILESTLKLCKQEQHGLLFVGGWGFSYEDNQLNNDEQEFLAECGFQITSRHD